jgi:hypothetical protein
MPGLESMGGTFRPRSTRSQTPMTPQSKFNMPKGSMGGGGSLLPAQRGGGGGLGLTPNSGAGGMMPPASGGGMRMPTGGPGAAPLGMLGANGTGTSSMRPSRGMRPIR